MLEGRKVDDVEQMLREPLHYLIEKAFESNEQLEQYQSGLMDFTHNLINGVKYGCLDRLNHG